MVHLIFCMRRLPHLSREEFQRYWHENHAALGRAYAPIFMAEEHVMIDR